MRERRVAIIGCGPKGLYGLERILAALHNKELKEPYEIVVFNRTSSFGPGEIYRTSQPNYLLTNYAVGNINVWPDQHSFVPGALSFTQWNETVANYGLRARDFAPRRVVGEYLSYCFQELLGSLPSLCQVQSVVAEVVSLAVSDGSYFLTSVNQEDRKETHGPFQHVLLASGHPRPRPQPLENFERNEFVDFIYPVERKLEKIAPNSTVAIKGLGLTFIDAVLALTEGRGGEFVPHEGGLSYRPSGVEPAHLLGYSRTGLPMLARPPQLPGDLSPPRYFTPEAVVSLQERHQTLDFAIDLRPLLLKEMKAAYIERGGRARHFEFDRLIDPLSGLPDLSCRALHRYMTLYQENGLKDALSPHPCPRLAASQVWGRVLPAFRLAYRFGGLNADSHRSFLSRTAGSLNRFAFGPPVVNAQKMVSLAEAGYLSFELCRGASLEREPSRDHLFLSRLGVHRRVHTVVDARIPKIGEPGCPDKLRKSLLASGQATQYVNQSSTGEFVPGCLSIDQRGRLLSASGNPTRITLTGTPTEGLVFDNDTLSRSTNDFVSQWATDVIEREILV